MFEKEYKDGMNMDEAVNLGLKALSAAIEEKLDAQTVECGIVEFGKPFRRLTDDELNGYIAKL